MRSCDAGGRSEPAPGARGLTQGIESPSAPNRSSKHGPRWLSQLWMAQMVIHCTSTVTHAIPRTLLQQRMGTRSNYIVSIAAATPPIPVSDRASQSSPNTSPNVLEKVLNSLCQTKHISAILRRANKSTHRARPTSTRKARESSNAVGNAAGRDHTKQKNPTSRRRNVRPLRMSFNAFAA